MVVMDQTFFQLLFISVYIAFTFIRIDYHTKAVRTQGKVQFKEGRLHSALRLALGVPFMLLLAAYMVQPSLLSWAEFPLPIWLQWVGVVLSIVSIPLIWWVQWALGSNFSTTLHIREHHTLVTHGPYRWVRHPMYSIFYMLLTGFLLLTGNWFIGVIPILVLTVIVGTRLRNEESAMIEKFGDAYREYMQHTGRFLPRLQH
jgi:protein-S-isoprenylcysteine O-methyltransferase Ste14